MIAVRPIDRVLDALGYDGQRNGNEHQCHCPAHDDRQASLSVRVGDDGRVLLHCHAGCKTDDIVTNMGLTMNDLFPPRVVSTKPRRAYLRVVATYDYCDVDGKLVYQVVRYEPKDFKQRRPDGLGEWVWNLRDTERVLYRLPELLAADLAQWVFVVEGEKDADNLYRLGLTATTNAQGADKWQPHFNEWLRGRRVCILPDNDDPGRNHARKIASELLGVASQVRVLQLPNLPVKGDVSDWLAAGGDADTLLATVEQTPDYELRPGVAGVDDVGQQLDNSKPNQADLLYALAREQAELFRGQDGKSYAFVTLEGRRACYRLNSDDFGGWMVGLYRAKYNRIPGTQAQQQAKELLAYDARATQREVYVRVGGHGGKVYIDLGSEEWDAIEIDADGWRIVTHPPVAFYRTVWIKPLPLPQRGANLPLLRKYLNIEPEHWPLIAAWTIAAMNGSGPYPILVLAGEQGTAKSTTLNVLKNLIDPAALDPASATGLRGQPSEVRDLMIGAGNSWLLTFDNVSHLNGDLSDALCRIATGGAYAKRALHTDDGEILIDVQRPVAINGIGDIITRPDLMDRCILLCPPVIPEDKRRAESEFWQEFNQDRPMMLGALLDALSAALQNYPHTQLKQLPRMADFARLGVAAEAAFESELSFVDAYNINREEAHATVVEGSPIGEHLRSLVVVNGQWEGTPTKLLEELNSRATESERRDPSWPRMANRMKGALQRLAPSLRKVGVEIEFPPRQNDGARIRLTRINL